MRIFKIVSFLALVAILSTVVATFVVASASYELGHLVAIALKPATTTAPVLFRTDVVRNLKGDRLTPEQLVVQWQGLRLDGTPVEEVEDDEHLSCGCADTEMSVVAKK